MTPAFFPAQLDRLVHWWKGASRARTERSRAGMLRRGKGGDRLDDGDVSSRRKPIMMSRKRVHSTYAVRPTTTLAMFESHLRRAG